MTMSRIEINFIRAVNLAEYLADAAVVDLTYQDESTVMLLSL